MRVAANRTVVSFFLTALVAIAVAGCGSSTSSTSTTTSAPATTSSSASSGGTAMPSATVSVSTGSVSRLGRVLVDGKGHTLYVFVPDNHAKVTCTGSCAQLWPPVKSAGAQKPTGSGGVNASLLGSDADPEGGRVVTYNGWPLYTYVGDSSSGQATGQGLETSGGLWYVISPAGVLIKKIP